MSPIRELTRREHHQVARRLSGPAVAEPQVRLINLTSVGAAVLPPVHRADVAVLARHRLDRDRLVVSRPALFERLSVRPA